MQKPQQCRIRGTSPTYTTTHSNARSLTHQVRPIVEPTTSWFLVGFVIHCATMGTKTYAFFYPPADFWYMLHLSATLLLSLMPIHSSECILSTASHSDLFSSWNFFCPTISVLCVFPTDFEDTLCFIILQVIAVWCHVLLPCWGLSVKASLRFFSLFSPEAPASMNVPARILGLKVCVV